MCIEIIAIGNELLTGHIVNTNAAYISNYLVDKGYPIARHSVLSDDEQLLFESLQERIKQADLIIVTGGLGPTFDDVTKTVVCRLFGDELVYNEDIAKQIRAKHPHVKENKQLAYLPKKAIIFPNTIGSAPGFGYKDNNKGIFFLPGVPNEMTNMWPQVFTFIENNFSLKKTFCTQSLYLCLLKELEVLSTVDRLRTQYSSIEFGLYPSYGSLTIRLSCEKTCLGQLKKAKEDLQKLFFSYLLPESCQNVVQACHQICLDKKIKIACAESCTGGYLSSLITALPGCSQYFLGTVVSYANELKQKFLHVPAEILQTYGAVSKQTVQAMLKGLFEHTSAKYAIALTGIAGPEGASKDKPLGLVYIAVAQKGKESDIGSVKIAGNRQAVIMTAAHMALGILWRNISFNQRYFS